MLSADLFIVDGPLGSPEYGRPDFIEMAKQIREGHEFIAIFDDCNRIPEQESFAESCKVLESRGFDFCVRKDFFGLKAVYVIATKKKFGYVETM